MGLLAARLALVDVLVLPLETATVLFLRDDLLQDGLLAVLVLQAAAVELSRAFNDGADLRESRNVVLRAVLLVVALGIKNTPHLEQLEITSQLWRELRLRHIEPLSTRSCFLFLVTS
jgi:hypothetical protein